MKIGGGGGGAGVVCGVGWVDWGGLAMVLAVALALALALAGGGTSLWVDLVARTGRVGRGSRFSDVGVGPRAQVEMLDEAT